MCAATNRGRNLSVWTRDSTAGSFYTGWVRPHIASRQCIRICISKKFRCSWRFPSFILKARSTHCKIPWYQLRHVLQKKYFENVPYWFESYPEPWYSGDMELEHRQMSSDTDTQIVRKALDVASLYLPYESPDLRKSENVFVIFFQSFSTLDRLTGVQAWIAPESATWCLKRRKMNLCALR